jgi:uncharacterized protein YjdB
MDRMYRNVAVVCVLFCFLAGSLVGCPPTIQVSITPDGGAIEVGDTLQLSATSTDSADIIAWSSDDEAIATVDTTGLVEAVGPGVAMITATGSNSGRTATVTVTVTSPAADVTVTPDQTTIGVGGTAELTAQSTDLADTFTWTSDADTVATVDVNGSVTGLSEGVATITATGSNSGSTGQATVTVTGTTITVTPDEITLDLGQIAQFSAMSTLAADGFTWSSNEISVVTIDPDTGELTAVGEGTAVVTATGTLSGAIGTADVTVVAVVDDNLAHNFIILRDLVESAPDGVDDQALQTILDGLDDARAAFFAGDYCDGAVAVALLLPAVQQVREAAKQVGPDDQTVAEFAEMTYAFARRLQYDLVLHRLPGDPCLEFERVGQPSAAEVLESNTERLVAKIAFGEPRLTPIELGESNLLEPQDAGIYTQLGLPDYSIESGDPGTPGIPVHRELVAVPPGATVRVRVEDLGPSETFRAKLMPHRPQPLDQVPDDPDADPADDLPEPSFDNFADRPFALDRRIYGVDVMYPRSLVTVVPMGSMRGVEMVQVQTFMGQYNPATEEVTLYEYVACEVMFEGGAEGFLPSTLLNPFESAPEVYIGAVLNGDQLPPNPFTITQDPAVMGEEFLILTHPSLRTAADALAAWKNQKGIMTNVFNAGSGVPGRETAGEIDVFIHNRFNTTSIKASYILLLGDSNLIPPFLINRINSDLGDSIGSDWFYAWMPGPGPVAAQLATPTFAVGRIPVITLADADRVVQKIISYEKTPPGTGGVDPFYNKVVLASQFQCCRLGTDQGTAQRTFTEVSELVRGQLVQQGYAVERIYTRTIDNGCATCDPPRDPYLGDPTPRFYYDGMNLPAALGPNSGFQWNGTTQDIADAINNRAFLVMHRDHGWPSGWSNPRFTSSNIVNLLNNAPYYPVVFSINCSSGIFDDEANPGAEGTVPNGIYFAERMLREEHGAVGIIGDTRVSPSWPNTALAKGLFDAIWPDTLPNFGGNTSIRRLGDILNHAKLYLLTQAGGDGPDGLSYANMYDMMYLYHVIGDPTLEIWTHDPVVVAIPSNFDLTVATDDSLEVLFPDGVEMDVYVTAYQTNSDGTVRPLGRAQVEGGIALMDLVQAPTTGLPIHLVANSPGGQSQSREIAAKNWQK